VIGLGRFGETVISELLERGDDVLGVDFDPRSVQDDRWDLPVVYGDAEDPDLPEQLPLSRTRWVISSLRDLDSNLHVVSGLRHHGYSGRIAVSAHTADAARTLEEAGADVTIRPLHVAARPLMELIHRQE
jgi:Trk K+ transport system NAD-binding subunit